MGRERHGERLLNKAAVLVALFAVCLRECSYGIYNQKSLYSQFDHSDHDGSPFTPERSRGPEV